MQKLSKDDVNYKPIANIETINILLAVLQLALPSLNNPDLIHEIQTMMSNAKLLNNFNPTRSEPFHPTLTHPFTPSPTNGPSLAGQLRSLPSNSFFSFFSRSIVADTFFFFFFVSYILEQEKKAHRHHHHHPE